MIFGARYCCTRCGEAWSARAADIDLWCDSIEMHEAAAHGPISTEMQGAIGFYRTALHLQLADAKLRHRKGLS